MIDVSINQTLGRSVMTSVTTLVVMIPLLIMGGNKIDECLFFIVYMVHKNDCLVIVYVCFRLFFIQNLYAYGFQFLPAGFVGYSDHEMIVSRIDLRGNRDIYLRVVAR